MSKPKSKVSNVSKKFFLPSLTTAIPERASGTLTPAAMNVSPMTVSGMPSVNPITVIIQTMTYEYSEIQAMAQMKVATKKRDQRSSRQSENRKKRR